MLEARTVEAALQHASSDTVRDVIKFNKGTNDHFQLRKRGVEAGMKGWGQENSCRVIESMKNEVLKAQRFEQL